MLRWMDGASHLDLCFAWGFSSSAFYRKRGVIWPTIRAINKMFTMGLLNNNEKRATAISFRFLWASWWTYRWMCYDCGWFRCEAFTNIQQFLSPWPGDGLDHHEDVFNYWLSDSHQCMERSFGMLMQCQGKFLVALCFLNALTMLHWWSYVILACMKLHNLCLD